MAEGRREPGGSRQLLDLIEEHRAAFDYDWRTRFHLSVEAIPDEMPWDEALRLTQVLAQDTSSHVGAALAGWQSPWPREAFLLADLFDLMHRVNSKSKPKPYPRPTDARPVRLGRPGSQRSVRAALRARGHNIEGGRGG